MEWNLTISNTSVVNQIVEWNLTLTNTTAAAVINISSPYPVNQSIGINLNITMHITINHSNGSIMNLSWYYGNSSENTTIYLGSHNNTYNGTYHMSNPNADNVSTTYYWRVNVTDGIGNYSQDIFLYTTGLDATFIAKYVFNYLPLLGLAIIPIIFIYRKRKKKIGGKKNE